MTRNDDSLQDDVLEAQQELLESSLPVAFEAYDQARNSGMKLPVVFLLDCEDPVGREIVQSWLGAESVQDAVEQRQLSQQDQADSRTTVFTHAFPWLDCRTEVPEVFPYLEPVFDEEYPENGFLAIAVTRGGASALTVPFTAREA